MPNVLRERVERASLPVLTRASTMPRLVPFGVMLVLLVGGALIGGWLGFILTFVAVLIVAWLLYLAWPRLTRVERLMRTAVLLVVAAVSFIQLFPRH